MKGRPPTPAHIRVLRRIEYSDDTFNGEPCWLFTGYRIPLGYGQVGVGTRAEGSNRLDYAHRVMYEHLVGPIPEGLVIDHLCRNPPCCNPAHLEAVTHAENMRRGFNLNRVKTHCHRGHEYTPENTYRPPSGQRVCRTCKKKSDQLSHQRRAQALNPGWV